MSRDGAGRSVLNWLLGPTVAQVGHLIHVTSGRIVVRMDDGSEAEFGPGDVGSIPARELKTPTPRSGRKNGGTHTSCSGFEDGRIQIVKPRAFSFERR